MEIVALIPTFIALYIAFTKSPERAFLDVYLPVVFFLPDYYRWIAPGLPDPTFSQGVVLVIMAAYVAKGAKGWWFSLSDVFVFGYAFCVGYSEYLNSGYADAQNLIFNMLAWVVCPYILAKVLIELKGLRVEFAKRLVFLLFMISVVSLYEFKFASTPWRMILDPFFPWQGLGWVTTFRWGFARVAGPYGHAILAGIILVTGYRIQRWLEWNNLWEPRFKKLPPLPFPRFFTKTRIITLGLLGGVIMTMCKGLWLGAMLAAGATAIGRSRNKKSAVRILTAGFIFIGIPIIIAFWSWASVGREHATSDSQETAAYRKELIDKYVDIAVERSWWGWGLIKWPKVLGMPSIDNYYLLLALMHGLLALGCFVGLIFYMSRRLFVRGMRAPPNLPRGGSLAFTLLAVYIAIGFSVATVYMGNQVVPLLFLISGWAEGYLKHGQDIMGEAVGAVATQPTQLGSVSPGPFAFRRVLV